MQGNLILLAVAGGLLMAYAIWLTGQFLYRKSDKITGTTGNLLYEVLAFGLKGYITLFLCINLFTYASMVSKNFIPLRGSQRGSLTVSNYGLSNGFDTFNDQRVPFDNLHMQQQILIDPEKKTLVVFKFDEIFSSESSVNKFENVNKFVNIVINTFGHMNNSTEVAIIASSPGGSVLMFERAYANLLRLSTHGFKTYAVIDGVCASGCYMLVSALDEIIAGNSSTIGSVGVYTKRYIAKEFAQKVGFEEVMFKTSNKKGDLLTYGNNTQESFDHVQTKLDRTMAKFVSIVKAGRPNVKNEALDADVFYSDLALEMGLIDKIQMPDDFLEEKELTHNIVMVEEVVEHNFLLGDRIAKIFAKISDKVDSVANIIA